MENLYATNGRAELCCEEHRESLELFCKEDESFICVLCVPRHSRHTFVFLHGAVSVYKDKLKTALTSLELKVKELTYSQIKQEKEIIGLQEDAFGLEQFIKRTFAELHQFLQGKEQNLIQQIKSKGHIAEIVEEVEKKINYIESDIMATRETLNSNMELTDHDPISLLTEDAFSLETYIKHEFAKLHQFLQDEEEKLIQQFKTEEANILNEMEENLECIKHDVVAFRMPVPDADLEIKNKEVETLKEVEETSESIESDSKAIQESFNNNLELRQHEPKGLLTIPETFEDVVVTFSKDEWKMLKKHEKDLYRQAMVNNYETMVSVGYKIPPIKLLLLLKSNDELPEDDVEGNNNPEQKDILGDNVCGNRSTKCSMSYYQQPSLGTFHYPALNLQQCAQTMKDYKKSHLAPVPQLLSGNKFSKSSECHTSREAHTLKKLYKCTECEKCFPYLSTLRRHFAVHTGEKPYKCTDCSKSFAERSSLRYHRAIHTGEKTYQCTECNKCFVNKSHLKRHQISHTGEKPYKCAECCKCFTHLSNLQQHQTHHTGDSPYKCLECNKCFTRLANLQQHQTIHTGEKPYKCAECGKCFRLKGCLKLHQKSHTGMKPYKCTECSKCFAHQSNLRKHLVIHTSEKPYECVECGKCFRLKGNLKLHQKSHTGMKPYKCTECGKCFVQLRSLRNHRASHIGES